MKIETSESSPIGINQVVPPAPCGAGWLAITLAPGKITQGHSCYWQRDLKADLDRLVELGTTTLVPLLEDDELVRLKIPNLVQEARDRGLDVLRFPFHDGGVPKVLKKASQFVEELRKRIENGERIVMHCNGGLGRAGTMAACVRLAMGLDFDPEKAIESVRKARGHRAIENQAQEKFVKRFENSWNLHVKTIAVDEADRRLGAWYGLAVGDALGAPVEFLSAKEIKKKYGWWTEMRAGGPWEKGEWTDDTALAIAQASAYSDPEEGYDLQKAASGMVSWLKSGPKDIGNQTRMALGLIDSGIDLAELPDEIQRRNPGGAGNGSLMRAAPTGLIRRPNDPRLIEETEELCRYTHPDERCVDACVAYNVILSTLVHENGDVEKAFENAISALKGRNQEVLDLVEDFRVRDTWEFRHKDSPIGYVLLCLEYALAALRFSTNFNGGMLFTVNAGGDTDTNAAVCGAILGAKYGYDQIPRRWLDALQKRDELDKAFGWIRAFSEHQTPEFELEIQDKPLPKKKAEKSLLDQAKANIPTEEVGKRILVASNLLSVEPMGELQYRFTWRIAWADPQDDSHLEDGKLRRGTVEFEVGAELNGKDQYYNIDEPVHSWGIELYHTNDRPDLLQGEDRLKFFTCLFVNKGMQRALQSGIYTIEAARENIL